MMRHSIILLMILLHGVLQAQPIYTLLEGNISFFSEAPVETIKAENNKCKSLINTKSNEIAVIIPVIEFHFEKPLMEEHFNENYMETEKYPTAVFKGKINEVIDFTKNGNHEVTATGMLNIHGVEQQRTIQGTLVVEGDKITVESTFKVKLEDHKIKIPKLVIKNIAEEVDVSARLVYEPKK